MVWVTEEGIIVIRSPGPKVNHVLDAVQPHLHIVSTVHVDLLLLVKRLVGIAREPMAEFDPKARSTHSRPARLYLTCIFNHCMHR